MQIGVVVPTIGASPSLGLVLDSLADQSLSPVDVVVVDQSTGDQVARLVTGATARLNVRRITSARGTSTAKNAGHAALGEVDAVVFLDDDCTLPDGFLVDLARVFEETGAGVVCGVVDTHGACRVAFGTDRVAVTRANVWTQTIEAATFYRAQVLESVGVFDETLGTGGPTRWQSGEGTDLVLRALDAGVAVVFDPSLVITEHQVATTDSAYLGKVRRYARGTGRVYRLRYPWSARALVVAKPLVAAAVHLLRGRRYEAAKKAQAALGRAEGMLGPARAA